MEDKRRPSKEASKHRSKTDKCFTDNWEQCTFLMTVLFLVHSL